MGITPKTTLVGQGAAKLVYITDSPQEKGLVFFTPQQTPFSKISFPWSKLELQREVDTVQKIKAAVEQAGGSTDHLAVDMTVCSQRIHGKYTIQAQRALGDLEKEIKKPTLTFTDRLSFCEQVLDAGKNLHNAGYVHGDIKTENMLVYEGGAVKLSDWGKASPQKPNTTRPYTGNARFSPPEYRTSYEGETYSLGLTLMRILEEALLSQSPGKEMLLEPLKQRIIILQKDHRGFVKYLYSHTESYQPRIKWIRRIKAWINKNRYETPDAHKKNQELTQAYIAEFEKRIIAEKHCSPIVAQQITALIKDMIHIIPSKRPSGEQAHARMREISALMLAEKEPVRGSLSYCLRYPLRKIQAAFSLRWAAA